MKIDLVVDDFEEVLRGNVDAIDGGGVGGVRDGVFEFAEGVGGPLFARARERRTGRR